MIDEIQIEISGVCNFNYCKYCLKPRDTRKRGFMKLSLFKKIIDQAHELGCRNLKASWFGETFILKNVAEYFEYAKQKDFRVFLFSNGSVVNKEALQFVDKLFISVDDIGKKYEHIRRFKFKKIFNNIIEISEMENRPELIITCLDNVECKECVEHLFKKYVDDIVFSPVIDRYNEKTDKSQVICNHNVNGRLVVGWDGKCYLCCQDWLGKYPIGDLKNNKIEKIWQGRQRKMYLKNLQNLTICQNCW